MSTSLDTALGRLRTLAAVRTLGSLSDGELLDRFLGSHDEAAFTVLIDRHGPMVLAVCRRALSNPHDAEDACQATFLVLARQAGSLRKKASLGCWLHGVARRIAATLKRDAARREGRERRAGSPAPADPAAEVSWREAQAILDEELGRLPDRYRAPLVLCYLECLTRDEAAARLGLSAGSLHGRLERGRELLRVRLTHRGLTLPGAMAAAALGAGAATAAVPPTVVIATAKAALTVSAGHPLPATLVSTNVVALFQEVVTSMYFAKLKVGAAGVLCAAVLALAGGSFVSSGQAQDARPKQRVVADKAEGDEAFIRRLSKDLREADPTPAEVHFFTTSKDADKRKKLIDLFVREREAKKQAVVELALNPTLLAEDVQTSLAFSQALLQLGTVQRESAVLGLHLVLPDDVGSLQGKFFTDLLAANDKAGTAKAVQAYLDGLIAYLKARPAGPDAAAAVRQIVQLYESQGKTVEAEAWRAKLPKKNPPVQSGGNRGQ